MRMDREQRKLDELIKELKDKEFKYIPREEREIDWSKYDEAQINDMLFFLSQNPMVKSSPHVSKP